MAGLEIEGEGTVDDWLDNPRPPPRPLGDAAHAPAKRKAPARPGAKPKAANAPAPAPDAAPKKSVTPLDQLGADLDAAPEAPPVRGGRPGDGLDPPDDPPRSSGDGGGSRPPKRERPKGQIWPDCPVVPLGVRGTTHYYLDVHGQMIGVSKHERQAIMGLFGKRLPDLCHHFAQWVKDDDGGMRRKPDAFEADKAAMAMIMACSEKGLFDPDGAVRGVGAWRDDDGRLIYHTGDTLIIDGKAEAPSEFQGRIYPAFPPIPHPAPADGLDDPTRELLEQLRSWQWERPEIDPIVTLGMLCVMFLGGALDWRPTFWITGARAAGKSSLQKLIEYLMGPKGLVQSTDATKSGITSRLGQSSLPVALDELEPGDSGSGKEQQIIDLARIASSGGQWFRGSSDQKGATGNVYSTFLFSSILIPGGLKASDLSRLIVLSLRPFPDGTPTPKPLRPLHWRKRGAALKRILMDRWPTWAERLELWRDAFAEQGIGGRNGDNWATIMAMADMARTPTLPDKAKLAEWTAKVARHVKPEIAEIGDDASAMVVHLLSQKFEPFKGREAFTVAQWLMVAGQRPGAPPILGNEAQNETSEIVLAAYAKDANKRLAQIGLRVTGAGAEAMLFIANSPVQGLKDLFRDTPWANGAWKQSAARIKGARPFDGVRTLGGIPTRGVEVPFTSLPGLLAFSADRNAAHSAMAAATIPPDMEDFA